MMKEYVLGFAFDKYYNVILVEKSKPEWQRGFYNGVGGKVEPTDKSPLHAMVREFQEETGVWTAMSDWKFIVEMYSDEWKVVVYRHFSDDNWYARDLDEQKTDTDETLKIMYAPSVMGHSKVISNLPWLIGMCYDHQMPLKHYSVDF